MTRLATSIMIFAVIRQSLDHSHHKHKHTTGGIDKDTQNYCFALTILFFIDFITAWFDQYSKYFAGDRMDKVSNVIENMALDAYDFKPCFLIISILSELFLVG